MRLPFAAQPLEFGFQFGEASLGLFAQQAFLLGALTLRFGALTLRFSALTLRFGALAFLLALQAFLLGALLGLLAQQAFRLFPCQH